MVVAIAEDEKSMIVLELRGARARKKARTGRCEGRKPCAHYPGEKRIVERVQALGSEGLGFARIADALNREGVQPRRADTRWHGVVVNRILSREVFGPATSDGLRIPRHSACLFSRRREYLPNTDAPKFSRPH